jgi:DNA primase
MAQEWIDYGALKASADMAAVLAHYSLKAPRSRRKFNIRCPFHDDREPSCGIDLDLKTFHCFGCKAKGNVLDFVKRMEGGTLPEAAEALADISGLELPMRERDEVAPKQPVRRARSAGEKRKGGETIKRSSAPGCGSVEPSAGEPAPVAENPPLRFELKLEREHPYLLERGIGQATIETFGLGVCPASSRSIMKGRLCIPVHNPQGELVAYAGRWLGDDIPEGEPRYKLPEGFRKSLVLYNLHRVKGAHELVIVEGYFSVFRLHELGVKAVALMGHDCSDEQISLLQAAGVTQLTLLLDGDEPGREAAAVLTPRLARAFYVHLAELPDDEKPDTVDEATLRTLLALPD